MHIADSIIEIRPRSAWESIDLGVLLARKYILLLMSTWLLITLPILLLLVVLLWDYPTLPLLIVWWLKPVFDRAPLYILSNAIFGNTPTIKQTLLFWLKSLKKNIITDLLLQRISSKRSFELPVQQLEGSTGKIRRSRLKILCRKADKASLLTIFFINAEAVLYCAFILLLINFIPSSNVLQEATSSLTLSDFLNTVDVWEIHLSTLLYVLILTITEPLYIACGFCLYLNRRTTLEAWDIELAFRRLSQRLAQSLGIITIAVLLLATSPFTNTVQAESREAPATSQVTEEPFQLNPLVEYSANQEDAASQKARDVAKKAINQIISSPPFHQVEEVTYFRWSSADQTSYFIGWFFHNIFPFIMWAIIILLVLFIGWKAFEYFPQLRPKLLKTNKQPPSQLFGLDITPATLPDDVLAEFESLWQQQQTRQALSLLYRALLSHLVHNYRIPLKSSHTEGEVVSLTERLQQPTVTDFTFYLTEQWQLLAYGHYDLAIEQKDQLCKGWLLLLQTEVKR